jgi:predicted nucleic acid-binding protein
MKIVVDTNILFSALLKEGHHFADTLQLSEEIEFLYPNTPLLKFSSTKTKSSSTASFQRQKSSKRFTPC